MPEAWSGRRDGRFPIEHRDDRRIAVAFGGKQRARKRPDRQQGSGKAGFLAAEGCASREVAEEGGNAAPHPAVKKPGKASATGIEGAWQGRGCYVDA